MRTTEAIQKRQLVFPYFVRQASWLHEGGARSCHLKLTSRHKNARDEKKGRKEAKLPGKAWWASCSMQLIH
jgi:hypothetical protein